jgi:hypothetical protein
MTALNHVQNPMCHSFAEKASWPARFCTICKAELKYSSTPLAGTLELGAALDPYTAPAPARFAGEEPSRHWFIWNQYAVGVIYGGEQWYGVRLRLTPPAVPPGSGRPDGSRGKEIMIFPLPADESGAEDEFASDGPLGAPPEPFVEQGVLMVPSGGTLLAADLLDDLTHPRQFRPVVRLDAGHLFLTGVVRHRGGLLAAACDPDAVPRLLAVSPAKEKTGVIRLTGGEWPTPPSVGAPSPRDARSEPDRVCGLGGIFAGDVCLLPGETDGERTSILLARFVVTNRLRKIGTWKWDRADIGISSLDSSWALGPLAEDRALVSAERPSAPPSWLSVGAGPLGPHVAHLSGLGPMASVHLSGGKIFGVRNMAGITTIEPLDDLALPRVGATPVEVQGWVVERVLDLGEQLAALVSDTGFLRLRLYNWFGQLTSFVNVGIGRSIAPLLRVGEYVVCLWQNQEGVRATWVPLKKSA